MRSVVVVASLFSLCTACSDAAADSGVAAGKVADPKAAAAAPVAPVTAVVPPGALGELFLGYEQLRALLADDNFGGIAAKAELLHPLARRLVDEKKPGAQEIEAGLAVLKTQTEPSSMRIAFGAFSQGVVTAIAADPTLQPGRFLFSCPMAKGYQQWVQLTPKMANPYMGKRMLECGTTVTAWKV